MTHRHLLPNEIDLLIDGEVGFGVAPLRAHVEECAGCGTRLAAARRVVDRMEDLPRFAPSPRFTERVMAKVQVVEPWYVAAYDAGRALVPRSPRMRLLFAASAAVAATGISASAVWIVLRGDLALYAVGLFADRFRDLALASAGSVIGQVLGPTALEALRTGGPAALMIAAGVAIGSVGAATLAFRAFAASSRRARE